MNIGVIGYKGKLGSELVKLGIEPIDCNITNEDSIKNALEGRNFDGLINCAAYTNVDGAEKDRIQAYAVNSFGPQNIAKAFDGYIIHLSTDYIFDGINGPYREEQFANPISAYGFSKYVGEVGLRPFMDRVLIVRTTILYNELRGNFISAVYNELKNGNMVKAPKYLFGNPTHVHHLALGLIACGEMQFKGIMNIAGENILSRYELAREIAIFFEFDPNKVISSVAWGEARRPERAGLVLDKAKRLGVPIFTLWEGLHRFRTELESNRDAN